MAISAARTGPNPSPDRSQRAHEADRLLGVRRVDHVYGSRDATGGLDRCSDPLDGGQGALEPRREKRRQQADRLALLRAPPARDPCPRRLHPAVRAQPFEPAAALRVERTPVENCAFPRALSNVPLVGERALPQ